MPVRLRLLAAVAAAGFVPLAFAQSDAAAPAPAAAPAAAAPASPAPAPADAAAVAEALAATPPVLDPAGLVKSNAQLKGKRFYVAEYRVLFEVEGKVTASTRAGYLPGIDYGATRMTVNYQWKQPDVKLLQAITDKAYADFLARLKAAGLEPEPADAFVQANGAIFESTTEATRPGAEVYEEVELGYGKRKYLVFAPTGTKMVARSFIGIGAGNIGKRIDWSKSGLDGISVGMVVNLAAQESSGGGSSIFKSGSSAQASAAMEIGVPPKQFGLMQTHMATQAVQLTAPLPVPGQFATLKQVGGYDTQKDAVMQGIQILGRLTMGVAGNNSKRVDLQVDADLPALTRHALQGMMSANQAVVGGIQ